MNIKSSTTKIATKFFTLTTIVLCSLIALKSHSQALNSPAAQLGKQANAVLAQNKSTASAPSAEVKNAVYGTLKQTTNRIFFERNEGQFHNPEVMYGFHTHFGSMGVYHNKLRIVSTQKEKEDEKPGEVDADEPAQLQIVDITFPGSKNNWTVETGTKSSVVGSYYNKDGKGVTPALYNEITLKNVYPGVDLRLYSGKMGSLEFDWLVTKASDYEKIRMSFNGQDSLNIEKEGNLLIKLHDNDMKMVIPETYQVIDGNKNVLKTRMAKIGDENTLCYKVSGQIDPDRPMVIDPVMIWSTFMNNASNTFDEYLYAVTSTPAGNVYCAGVCDEQLTTAYMSGVAAGYSGNYIGTANGHNTNAGATSECIVYEFNAAGTAVLAWSYTGITVIVNNGQTNPLPLVPTDVAVFPNGRVIVTYSEDVIQIFSSNLGALLYSGSTNPSSAPSNLNLQAVCVLNDSVFYVSGITTSAYPAIVAANAPDPTFAGASEGLIMRETLSSTNTPAAAWGTYVGGNNSEGFAAISLTPDHSKLVFSVQTVVGAAYPAVVNAVKATPGGSTELLVGVIPVSATPQTAFSVFSYLGGSGAEGLISDVPESDKTVVCADNNYFYVGGNTYSTDLAGASGGVQPALKGGIDQFISRIPLNGSAGTGFVSTYNGGSGTDLVGGIAVDFRSNNVLLFGTTGSSTDFPVLQTTPSSPYYQSTFGGGSWDIAYGSFTNDLTKRTFGTYIGGANNDYLGSTGVLRGCGHLFYNLTTGLINIGTTIHSDQTTIPVQWMTDIPGFDKVGGNANNDNHFIFEWDPNTFDYGDAPSSYDGLAPARSALSQNIRLGLLIDAETAPYSSYDALGDDTTNLADEDGVVKPLPTLNAGTTTYSLSVSVYNNTGSPITLAGWLDANGNHLFDNTEYATMSIPTSASQQHVTLTWTGLVPLVYGTGQTFVRLRLTDGPVTAFSDTGEIQAGEVEDYQICIKPNAGPDQTICIVGTATMAATGTGTWTALSGNPGTATITNTTSPTTTITGFSAVGTYNFLWTNSTGCSDTAAVIVTAQPGSVTVTPSTVNLCTGGSVVLTASASPTGGTYQWSPLNFITPSNGVGASVTVAPPATQTYSVVYTLGGCTSGASRTVTVYATALGAHAGGNQTYCSNVSTTISLGGGPTGTGGSGNYSYTWSPGTRLSSTTASNPTITSIVSSAIKYYVTVTDQVTGCTAVDSMVLTINPSVSVSIGLSDTNLCLGQSTPLVATGTPSGGSYTWTPTISMSPAAGNTASVTVSPSTNQTYTVVYSLTGCTGSAARTINVYPNVAASAGGNQTFCLPVSGTIRLGGNPSTAIGGSGSFTYAWSPSTNLSSTSVANPTIISPTAGTTKYYVTVTDTKSGCTAVDSMILTINPKATVTISSADTNLCTGLSSVLVASGLPAGGTYQWSPVTAMTPVAGNTASVTVAPTSNQTYQVIYTASGCSDTAAKTVNVVSTVVAHAGGNQTFCMPVSGTITLGALPSAATGGSGSYTYLWSPNTRISSTNASNPTITSIVASTTTYKLLVTDNVSGCTALDSAIITINPAVIANAGPDTSICAGFSIKIGGSPTGSGGTGSLTYAWAPGTGLSAVNISNPAASPTALTSYVVTVTDSKGCSASSSTSVSVNPNPSANAGPSQNLTACSAATVTLGSSPTGSGGTGALMYNWSPSAGLDSTTVSNPTVSQLGSTTTYRVTVTDSKGCTATSSTIVTVVSSTLQVDAGTGGSYCAGSGGSVSLSGSVTGGTAPYRYIWTPSTGLSDTNQATTSASPTTPGSYLYNLNVTDTNGCQASDTVRVTVYPYVYANAGSGDSVCAGYSIFVGGIPTGSGGTGALTYQWASAPGLNPLNVSNPAATPSANITYSVTVTDSKNCSASSSVFVKVNQNPVAHAGTSQSFCLPVTTTISLGASQAATGGSGNYKYQWSPTTNLSDSTTSNPTVTVNGATNITYKLTVTDAVTGCTSVDSTNLTILAQPSVSISTADSNVCSGQSTVLTAAGSPAGGSYQWAPLVNIAPGNGASASVTVTPSNNQTYQVIYTQNTCTDTAYKTVVVYSTVVASAAPNQSFCLPVTGTITIGGHPSASGGSGHYGYLWSPVNNLSSRVVANPTITTIVAGTTVYTLTVTDSLTGCSSVDSMVLTINPVTTVTINAPDTSICEGQSTTLTATGSPAGGTYQWSPTFNMNPGQGNTAAVVVAPSGTQPYQVTYNASGCSGTATTTVYVYPKVVSEAGQDQSFCLPYSGTITIGASPSASGGSGNYSYRWFPGTNLIDSTLANPTVNKVNTNIEYYLEVTDNVTGCTSIDSMHLHIDTHATLSIAATDTNICFGQSAVLTAVDTPSGGTYQWSPIVYLNPGTGNTQSVTVRPTANQLYQLVYSRNGCNDTAYQDVNVYPDVTATAGGNQTYCLPITGTVTLGGSPTAKGGSGNYIYTWAPNINLSDSTVANPTLVSNVASTVKYYLTVTDAVTGCSATDSMVLTITQKPSVTIFSPSTNICAGSYATLTATGLPAGGNYQWEPIIAIIPGNGNAAAVEVSPSSGFQTYFVYYSLLGCSDTASVQINTYPQPVANAGPDQIYCLPVASVTLGGTPTATGGSGSYSYHWTPSINVSDSTAAHPKVDSLNTPGSTTYIVTVTDNVTGCISVDSMELVLLPKPIVTITSPDTNLCAGQSSILIATGNPSGGSYQWAPLGTISPFAGNTDTISVTPVGVGPTHYQVIYNYNLTSSTGEDSDLTTNFIGCYDTAYQTVHIYPTIVANAGPDVSKCLPLTSPLVIGGNPSATGGSGNFSYQWLELAGVGAYTLNNNNLANPTVTAVSTTGPATFVLKVTDNLTGCSSTDTMVLSVFPQTTVSIAATDTNICVGGSATLTGISGNPAGGTYQWYPPFSMVPGSGLAQTVTVSPASTQTYNLIYTTNNICADTVSKTINVYPVVVAHGGGPRNFCSPINTLTLGGAPTATGGTGHFSYAWSPKATLNDSTLANPTATPIATTTYYLTVTDLITGCTSVDSVLVTQKPGPPAKTGPTTSICTGGSVVLSASGGISYVWSNGSTLSNDSSCCPIARPGATTIYTVTVTDINGCTASAVDTINVGSTLVFSVPTVAICQGDTGLLTPSLLGLNYRYAWSPGTGLSCVSCATPQVFAASSTIYSLIITDTINGCSGSDTGLVIVHPNPIADFFGSEVCQGQAAQFTDSSTSVDPIVRWFYNFGDSTLTGDTSDLQNPTYIYQTFNAHNAFEIVTTIYGCSNSTHRPVYSFPPVTAYAGHDTCVAFGSSIVLGATGADHFSWTPTSSLTNYNTANPVAHPDTTTEYTVVVTNDNGCFDSSSVLVTVVPLPNANAGPDTFVCVGNSIKLLGSSTTSGVVTFHWSSIVSGYLNNPNISQPTVTPTAPGLYTFVLTTSLYDTACNIFVSSNDTMTLTVDPVPQITANPDSLDVCGNPVNINFSSSLSSTTYSWTGSNGTSGTGNISTFINNTSLHDSTVIYTVVGTAPGGCTDTIRVPVIAHPVPVLTASGFPAFICSGTYYTGTVSSNTPGTSITWSSTAGPNGSGGNINQLFNNPGTIPDTIIFSFNGTRNGCVANVLYDTVIVYPLPTASAGPNVTIVSCSADSIQIGGTPNTASGGTPGYTYKWSPPSLSNDTIANPYVKNIGANTTYTVTVTDSKGCTASSSMNVTVQPPTLAVSISPPGISTWCANSGNSVALTANVSGGNPLYSFIWSPSVGLSDTFSQSITASPQTSDTVVYTVVVTDRNGCQASATKEIIVKPQPHPVITNLDSVYCANIVSVPLTASIPGGTWSGPGVFGSTFRPSLAGLGTYTIVYTLTSGGCTNDTFQTITVDSLPVVSITGANPTTYCSLDPSVTYTGSPAGGKWSGLGIDSTTGLFNPSLVSIPNNISRTITLRYHFSSAGGCTDSASTTVTVNKSPGISITMSADTICQHQSVVLTPHFNALPPVTTVQWFNLNGSLIITTPDSIIVNPTQENQSYYATITSTQGCQASDTVSIHVNQSPYAAADYDTICGITTDTINVLANDTDPENNAEVLQIVIPARHGKAHVSSNEIVYSQAYGYFGYDTLTYSICNAQCLNDCDTANVYLSICPRNLPPTADTIRYTQLDSVPQDVNVISATSSPNGSPLTISLVGDSSHNDSLVVLFTGNGSYTITGNDTGTFVIRYQVCDSDQYPVYVLCDSSVIIAHIVLPPDTIAPQPPVANNDYATTTGTAPAIVNVRANDYTNPTSHGLTTPTLIGSTTTADGTWSVNGSGMVVFQPNSGLAPGIYRDTIHYQVCDLVDVPQLCATAFVVVTTDEIDTPANRPPVAVNDHETVGQNTTSSFNVKTNDSDPDGDSLSIPHIFIQPVTGTIVSVADNGTVVYKSNTNLYSASGQPIDSFAYYICDTLAAHPVWPLCDTAEVYIYVTPRNLPPTADTIVYTQLVTVPQDVNVSLATSDPNGDPLNISLIGDSTDGHNLTVTKDGNGAYTITGNTIGTYVITYQVCDTDQYPIHVLCDTSFIIAHIVPPFDTLSSRPPVANNDFATTTGTTPATVNVRGNDYSNPTSHGLTVPTLIGSDTTADGIWTVNGNGQVVFQPDSGLAPGIYYDTIHYQVCDLVDVPQLCATAYVVVTTNEIDTPIYNRPPVAVNDHETVPMNTTSSFNVKANDSDPDGNPLTIPTIVSGDSTHNGAIVSIGDNGTIVYAPHFGVHSINGQPVDSFKYSICDSLAAHPVSPLCDSAEVYIYVVPQNLPPTADTLMYTQLDSVPQDVNVISVTGSPNGTPLTISLVGDSSHNDSLTVINTGNGSYTIIGNDTGTYVITYQVCDSSQYPIHVLCDTSVIIAHIIPPADTLTPQPPVANNDFATTSGTAPATVNVLANDYSIPTSHGLTTPQLISNTTTTDGTWSVNGSGQVVFQPNAGLAPGIYHDTVYYKVCDLVDVPQLCATAYVVVTTDEIDTPIANRPPVAVNDHETIPMNTTSSFNVKANDSDPDGDSLSIPHIISGTGPQNGTIVSVGENGTIVYTPHSGLHSINNQPVDSFAYYICDTLAAHPVWPLCDTAEVYIYVTPQNLPPTADTLMYTQLDSVPQDVNVISVTGSPNGTPLTISLVGDSSHNDSLTVINTGNGSYTIIGNDTGTYVITYQVCDSSQYPIHVLCDTSVIIAHIIPPADTLTPQPPVANNDFATTSGTAPATVNVLANDYSIPTSHGLTTPQLISNTTTTDGTWSVNGSGQVVFQPNAGLAPGIYHDTVYYKVCDLVDVPQLCATAYVVVTTDEIDTPIANRPPVAVNDHETIPMNTTSSFNVKANDSDPDGDSLSIPHIISGTGPQNGTIVSVADNGTVVYKPNPNVESINNQPVDSFAYYICDTLAAHPVWPLCDTAEVYIYVTPRNLPPTADTIMYTQLDSVPQDVNVISATSDPNGDPLTISLIGDSTDGGNLVVVKNGNGSYTITGNTIGTYVITYQVCDTDKYPIHVLCDTSVIIAHIVPPSDTLTPQPPVANNDFATTSGTAPATVNVLANDYSIPTSHGLTTPQLISNTTTTDGTWTVNGSGQVIFQPNSGLAPGIYHDTVYYKVCDLIDVPQLCATAYVVVTTNEIDTPIANRPPVAVDDHETVPENVPTGFNVKINDSDPDGDSLTIPTIVVQPLHGTILSVGENGTVVYQSDTNIHSTNSHTPVDSFRYYICDTLAAYPVRPLCDSAEVYIYVPQSLFAINDSATTSCSTPVVVCVKNNDYDTEHDSFYVKGIVTPPAHGTATLDSLTQCVTYTPNGYAASFPGGIVDSFRYFDQDILGATDSAWVYVKVICCAVTANNDTFTTHFGDTLYGNILRNDLFNDSLTHTVSILSGSGPTGGTVTVFDSIIIYIPHSGFCGTDNFKYILTGSCGQDTASVHITVLCDSCQKPIAVDDSSSHGYSCKDTINVLANDTFGVGGAVVTVIRAPLYGTDTVINNSIVYIPDGTHPSTEDSLEYSLCNSCGQCDTATVRIYLQSYPCAIDHPVVNNVVDSICKNTNALINVLASDSDPAGQTLYISLVTNPAHGSAFNQGDTLVLYHPDSSFVGVDTFAYQVCNTGAHLCNTGFVFVDVLPCLPPPIIVDTIIHDTTIVCTAKTFCIDSIYQGAGYFVRFYGFCDSASHGSVLLSTDTVAADSTGKLCFTYTPNCDTIGGAAPYSGNDTFCLVICDTGHDTVCTVTHVVITILPKPSDDTLTAHPTVTYICNEPDTVHVLLNDGFPTPGNATTGTAIYVLDAGASAGKAPAHGTVSIGPGDSTVIYIPNAGYSGVDTFLYVITNNGLQQLYDTSIVYVYVCVPPHPIAVNDNPGCLDTTGYVNQIDTINIIGNDTLFPANDTAIIIIDSTMHGRLIINPNFTVTYVPDSGFRGSDNFSYQIAEFVGSVIGYSDTATVCIDVVDTIPTCFFPNGISPNGDGINDVFVFPCNDQYPNASLLIFNRWGDKIWEVENGYKNDWGGTNLQGTPVPDGTYYFVYKYNDGSGRSTARFVVVYRGQKQ